MGFLQTVCPKCGSYIVAPFNSVTSTAEWECSSLACGWRGDSPAQVYVSYSDNTVAEKPVVKKEG